MGLGFITIGLVIVSGAGVALGGYLLWQSLRHGAVPGCGPGSACDEVMSSRWARWLGMPVAGPGMGVYALALVASLLAGPLAFVGQQKTAWAGLVLLAAVAVGAGMWFTLLQLLVIGRVCRYCSAMHLCGLILAGLVCWGLSLRPDGWAELPLGGLLATGLACLGVLVAGQVLIRPRQFVVSQPAEPAEEEPQLATPTLSQAPDEEPPAIAPAPVAFQPEPLPAVSFVSANLVMAMPPVAVQAPSRRRVSVLKGKVQLWADEWPICGSAQARHVLIELFDYTCPDCRHVHPLVRQAVDAFSGQLAVLSVPIPLDPLCNPLVPMLDPRHAGACDYARLALALWRIDRQAFEELDQTLWAGSHPPPIEQVRQEAQRLTDPGRLEQALHEPVAQQRQIEAIGIFQSAGVGKLPKLLLPEASLWGRVPGTKELFEVLQKQLGMEPGTERFSGVTQTSSPWL